MSLEGLHYYYQDCLEGLRVLPEQCVDLVFADLPYGKTRNAWDKRLPIEALWAALKRVAKPAAPFVFTAQQPFTSLLVASNLAWFRYSMVWHKNKPGGFLNARKQPLRAHEDVLVFYAKQPIYRPQLTNGHVPSNAAKRKPGGQGPNYNHVERGTAFDGGKTWRYPTSVLEIPIVNNDDLARIHPTQKPEALPAWFIKTYTSPGDLVLDPTAGSGSTLGAAFDLGRRFVGFENNPEIYQEAYAALRRRGALPCRTP